MSLAKKLKREARKQEQATAEEKLARARKIRRVAVWASAGVLILGAGLGVAKLASLSPEAKQPALLLDAISPSDWFTGNKDSKVVLVEYSDFQCPACGAYYPIVKKITQEFGDKILFVYRHFPLPQHQNARLAAAASEAAGKQGKFWEMHDLLFEKQNDWAEISQSSARDAFIGYATSLNIDTQKFKADIDSSDIAAKVENDYKSGNASGVNATPTFFLNGKNMPNPRTYDEFKNNILQQLGQGQ